MIVDLTRRLAQSSHMSRLSNSAFVRFAVVGLITTALDFILFGALTSAAGMKTAVANLVSYSCGIAISFALNRMWTFGQVRGESPVAYEALKFATTHAAGLTISTVLVSLLALFFPPIAAKAISVPIVFVWNYVLARFWVFR
jgi:putative flippase GtrA